MTERSPGDEPSFGLYYDFRCLDEDPRSLTARWQGILEQVAWAESLGFSSVWVSEHHFVGDDYAASTLTLAAALAARTSRMAVGTNVVVLPVHDPIRLAEDALTVDALSGGRLRLGVGMGYRATEFEAFGTSLRERRRRFEARVETLRRAFAREPVSGAPVSPRPVRPGGPELWIGALSEPGVRRAARMADGFLCAIPQHMRWYADERRTAGLDPGRVAAGVQWIVSDDPERTFSLIGQHVLYQANAYIEFGMFGPPDQVARLTDPRQLIDLGLYRLLDGPTAARELLDIIRSGPVVDCHGWTLFPGEPLESAAERIEYTAATVIPAVRAALQLPHTT